ncbi:MAG: hypothetical protein UHY58_07950 [Alistipes sp.]|nr:hypothetical protein [Alistipes sp.]
MAIVFKFRMLSDENDHFVRDYDVLSDMTLYEFHEFIRNSLEYEDNVVSFFQADDRWEKLREFTLMDMGLDGGDDNSPVAMTDVTLQQIMRHIGDRLIYQFDLFGNRAYYLELIEVERADPEFHYPRESFAHGATPDQYEAGLIEDEGSIFDEMMGSYSDFEGDDSMDDEYRY